MSKRFTKKELLEKSQKAINLNSHNIDYTLSKSPKRKSIAICIDNKASLKVYAPKFVTDHVIENFIKDKSDWIIENLKKAYKQIEKSNINKFSNGSKVLFMGKECILSIIIDDVKRECLEFDGNIFNIVLSNKEKDESIHPSVKQLLMKWLKNQAKEVLGSRLFYYSRLMKVEPKEIAIRQQKRIWGNCYYHKKIINLNWQIISAPIEVIDYIIVHELSHLVHPNHSKVFWTKVAKYVPDLKGKKKWLKDNAARISYV